MSQYVKNSQGEWSQRTLAELTGSKVTDVVLHDAITAPGNGTAFAVGSHKTLILEVNGTSVTRRAVFEARVNSQWYNIAGIKLFDMSLGAETTTNNELWSFDITGLSEFRVRVSDVTGGTLNIKGKAVV